MAISVHAINIKGVVTKKQQFVLIKMCKKKNCSQQRNG
jgi:hypothetical protein